MEHPPNVYCILVCKSIWFACIETLKDDHTLLEIRNPFAIDGQISWKKEFIWYEYRYARNESYPVTEWIVHEQHQWMGPSIPNPWWSPTKSKIPWDPFWVRTLSIYLLYILNNICGMCIPNQCSPQEKVFHISIVYPTIMLFLFQALLSRSHLFYSHPERNVCHGGRSDFNPSFAGMECCGSAVCLQSSVSHRCFSKNLAIFWCFLWLKNHLPPKKKSGWVSTRILVPPKKCIIWEGWRWKILYVWLCWLVSEPWPRLIKNPSIWDSRWGCSK